MKTTYTDIKPLNQYEKNALLMELEQTPDASEIGCGNILILRDENEIRIFTIIKEEIITEGD